jgi:hypothetical protein
MATNHITRIQDGKNRRNYHRRMLILLWVFGVLSLVAVPVFTLFLGSYGNPLTSSLSKIGNGPGMRGLFLSWTASMGAYYSGIVFTLIVLTKNTKAKILRGLILVSTWFLLATNLIPFLPDRFPFLARLHSNIATISILSLSFTMLLLTLTFRNYYPKLFLKAMVFLAILLVSLLQLYIFLTARWIPEVASIIGSSVFLFVVLLWLYKENHFDAEDVLHTYDLNLAEQEVKHLEERAKQTYDEYLKLTELSRNALIELEELKKANAQIKVKGSKADYNSEKQ